MTDNWLECKYCRVAAGGIHAYNCPKTYSDAQVIEWMKKHFPLLTEEAFKHGGELQQVVMEEMRQAMARGEQP